MMQLNPAQRAKLEGIVAAGGLTKPADVVRVPVAPSDPEVAAVWQRYLTRNYDSLVAMAQRICGPLDLVLFDGNTLTVCRHPRTQTAPDRVRAEMTAHVRERLFGRVDSPGAFSRMAFAEPPSEPIAISLGQDKDETLSPELETALRVISGLEQEPPPPAPVVAPVERPIELKMQRVNRGPGHAAVWMRSVTPEPNGAGQKDYFRPDNDLVAFDIALMNQTAQVARRMLEDKAPPVQLMFPVNINGFRNVQHRQTLIAALRDMDNRAAVRMEPVLVRCETGVPQSAIAEAAGYLRNTFNLVWVFAGRNTEPRTFLFSDLKMGVMVSGGDPGRASVETWRVAAEKIGWQCAVLG